MTYRFTATILLGFILVACSQERVAKVAPRPTSSSGLAIPRFDKGAVEDGTYKNASLGVEITPPPNFEFGTPQLEGSPGTVPLLVTIGAWGEEPWSPVRNGVTFWADALAYYPADQRSTEDYIRKVVRENRKQGAQQVGEVLDAKWGGVSFSRVDFRKRPAYLAILVKACRTQALVFIFSSSDLKNVNRLIAGSKLELSMPRSRCSPNSTPK